MPETEITITLSQEAEEPFKEFLHQNIRRFNDAHSPHFLKVRKPRETTPLHILVKGKDGEVLGGLTGSTYWGWLDIDDFFLPDQLRGQGIGEKILRLAESTAIRRGCTAAFLTTYAFQARGFYEKQGYRVAGTLEGYPPGSSYYWMRKDFRR